MPEQKPKLGALTYVGFQVAAALADNQKILPFGELYTSLDESKLFEWLELKLPDSFDFSLFKPGDEQTGAVQRALTDASWGYRDRERKKSGIESSALHLLLAIIFEAIQRHYWVED